MTTPTTVNMNTLSTLDTDPFRNFKFLVTFTPKDSNQQFGTNFGKMGFVSVSGFTVSTESIAYREGGYNTNVHQLPGQTSFTPLTLSKGVMLGQKEHSLWMKRLFAVMTGSATSGVGANFRCDVDIQVLSHPNPKGLAGSAATSTASAVTGQHTSMRFKVYNAWITNLGYSQLDAGGSTLMVEEMTLVHEGFDVSFATGWTAELDAPDLPTV